MGSSSSPKDIERFMRERAAKKPQSIPMPDASRRAFNEMKPDLAALQRFEEKVQRTVEKAELQANSIQTDEVINVMGSTAGAGSGDFHTYRGFRMKEMIRIQDMEAERKADEAQRAWEQERAEREAALLAKSSKRAAKRERQKQKAKEAKRAKGSDDGAGAEQVDGSDNAQSSR